MISHPGIQCTISNAYSFSDVVNMLKKEKNEVPDASDLFPKKLFTDFLDPQMGKL